MAFRSVVTMIAPAGSALGGIDSEMFPSFVPPRMVDACDLPGTAGGGVPRESLVWPKSMFCATRGDHWDGSVVSVNL